MRLKRPIALSFLFLLLNAAAWAAPEWTYPLAANILEDKGGYLVLTNKSVLMDASFEPHDLVTLNLRATNRGYELRGEAAEALSQMFKASEEEAGLKLYVKSAYRSYQTQSTMYDSRLSRNGKDDGVVAFPGSSDHQTGLGVDLLNYDWTRREGMTAAFGETQEAKWMEENAARFGYTLRYMPEKQEITGIIYEPWHFRYVGREAAAYMMDNRLSLEEFTQESNAAIKDYESRGGDFAALCRELNAPPAPIMLDETDEEGDGEVSLFYPKP